MSTSKKTDFFIAGNSKSGTTALYNFLRQHPALCMSEPKEPNFFAHDFCHDKNIGAFTRKSEKEYRSFFDDPTGDKLWGEASASYLYSTVAAREIASYNPAAEIIIMLREPVSFLHSYHLQMLKNVRSEGETVKDFQKALSLEKQRKHGRSIPEDCLIPEMLYYSDRIKYAEQVQRFLKYFEKDQVKIIIYEDFKSDNAIVFRDVLRFLKVSTDFEPTWGRHNKGERLKSKTMQRLIYDITHGKNIFKGIKPILKMLIPRKIRKYFIRKFYRNLVFAPKPDIDPALKGKLKMRFHDEVEKISDLLGRDLEAEWGYNTARKEVSA